MSCRILAYGHGDKSKDGFPREEDIQAYIGGGVFRDEDGRYRYSQRKRADVIVLTREGSAYGHFVIDSEEEPTAADRKAYPPVKKVYIVHKAVRYACPVPMSDLGITRYQFGKYITEGEFQRILKLAGEVKEFRAP